MARRPAASAARRAGTPREVTGISGLGSQLTGMLQKQMAKKAARNGPMGTLPGISLFFSPTKLESTERLTSTKP